MSRGLGDVYKRQIEKNVSFHTARHSFATLSLAAGSDLYTVGKLLGHTNIRSTQVYADVVMETKIEAVNQITESFSNADMGHGSSCYG